MSQTLKELIAKKRVLKTKLTKMKQKLSALELETSDYELFNENLKQLENEFKELFDSLYSVCKEDAIDDYIKEQEEVNDTIDDMAFDLNRKLSKNKTKDRSAELNLNSETNIKLPKINLPSFSGNLHEWLSFKDIFKASIHQNKNLSDAMKLQYLKSSLKGDAFRIVQSISIVDSNYELAWSLLEERYSNSREQVYAHLKRFMNMPVIQSESSSAILNLIDIASECMRSLETLEQKVEGFSTIMFAYILSQKLDINTKLWWERNLKKDSLPNLPELLEFLKDYARTLNASNVNIKRNPYKTSSMVSGITEKNVQKCNACNKENHNIYKCSKFLNFNVRDRVDLVKKQNLCFNCLRKNHSVRDCSSHSSCNKCNKKHHSLLCFEREKCLSSFPESRKGDNGSENTAPALNSKPLISNKSLNADALPFETNNQEHTFAGTANVLSNTKRVLLATAVVYIKGISGNFIPARCVIDSGSQSNFATYRLINSLQTRKEKIDVLVSCVTGASMSVKFKTTALICNNNGDYSRELDFLIVPKITHITPSNYVNLSDFKIFESVDLADPEFNKPGKIDLLLGAEVFFELLRFGQLKVPNSNLILQNSVFGFIVSGVYSDYQMQEELHCGLVNNVDLANEIKRFWEIEQVEEIGSIKSAEEIECNKHFIDTHKRDNSGRFVVQMPFKGDPSLLGDSKQIALNRLNSLWNRLDKDPKFAKLYCQFMREYENLGHMEQVFETEEPQTCYYLPHHGVYRPEKGTTKLRVVFNGSQLTSSGQSLNSIQLNGGVIQDELFSMVLRFRTYLYAFTADIKMMYRMINIDECQRDLQRIVWKNHKTDDVKTYRLCTVTYGTTSAPYLAMRCLKQLAIDGASQFPSASAVVQSNCYMDDILSGGSNLETVKILQKELIELFATCGMQLHKWSSNHPDLMTSVSNPEHYDFDQQSQTKVLGLQWKSTDDTFSFSLSCNQQHPVTKRNVLSTIARIFDPLGLLGPIITKAKVFLQRLWRLQIDWDKELPDKESHEWLEFVESLRKTVNNIRVDRYVLSENATKSAIFGFADASENAYGAVLYVVCTYVDSNKQSSSRLLCSKSRVSPIKTMTIPRLELCAAVLLAKLVNKVVSTINIEKDSIYLYSDSTIVLAWIKKCPSELKTFVASRVATIQRLTDINQWRHVPSQDNPADLVSRGLDPEKLLDNKFWFEGSSFLTQDKVSYAVDSEVGPTDNDSYLRELKCLTSSVQQEAKLSSAKPDPSFVDSLLKLSNNYDKILRIFCYILRFIQNLKRRKDRATGPLTLEELTQGEKVIIKTAQLPLYGNGKNTVIGNLYSLNPFIDENGILRVGGRLEKASLPFDHKFPIILPKKCKLSQIVFYTYHLKFMHVGPQALLNAVRTKFWPLGGRNLARKTVHLCVTCFKCKPILSAQIMSNLPSDRINESYAFNCTGLDLCGPFHVTYKNQRKGVLNKIYICVCICFVTRAIHLELLSDLTSDALIATLKRFFARRGKSSKIFTDNATNFVGANQQLKKWFSMIYFPNEELVSYLNSEHIDWHFIPPKSPHFGGLWESAVKSVKQHLKRVIGNLRLTYEEFETIVIQIEGILNSRPLTPLSNDDDCFEVLTPGHFLIGRSLAAIPEPQLIDTKDNRLSRWQRTTKIVQTIWKKWKTDYLNTLQQRSKWMVEKHNISVGAMVLIKEDYLPCCKWLLGRIIQVYKGTDGRVRVVKVRTQTGELKRAINKIAVLPIEN